MTETKTTKKNNWKVAILSIFLIIVVILSGLFYTNWYNLSRPVSALYYPSLSQQELKQKELEFSSSTTGLPFWIWVVLPRLFPEKLPSFGGYTALGLTWKPGNQLPNGLTQEYRGVSRVILANATPPFNQQNYQQFFLDCAQDPRFNSDFLLPEITYNVNLSWYERLSYRLILIPSVKKSLITENNNQ